MNTWPNRGASGGPCGGLADNEIKQSREVSPSRSDSSQQASSKPGAVQERWPSGLLTVTLHVPTSLWLLNW